MQEWDVERLMSGIQPVELRPQVWTQLSGAAVRAARNPDEYTTMLRLVRDGELALETVGDIDRDVDRIRSEIDPAELANCLKAFCASHKSVSYCQPLCFIAAFLLEHLSTELGYHTLVRLHQSQCRGYWSHGMIGWKVDEWILTQCIRAEIPNVAHHLTSLGLQPEMLFGPASQTLFVSHLPKKFAAVLWDVMLCVGVHFLHCFTLALFRRNEQLLLSACSAPEAFQLIGKLMPSDESEFSQLVKYAVATEPRMCNEFKQHRMERFSSTLDEIKSRHLQHFKTAMPYIDPLHPTSPQRIQNIQ